MTQALFHFCHVWSRGGGKDRLSSHSEWRWGGEADDRGTWERDEGSFNQRHLLHPCCSTNQTSSHPRGLTLQVPVQEEEEVQATVIPEKEQEAEGESRDLRWSHRCIRPRWNTTVKHFTEYDAKQMEWITSDLFRAIQMSFTDMVCFTVSPTILMFVVIHLKQVKVHWWVFFTYYLTQVGYNSTIWRTTLIPHTVLFSLAVRSGCYFIVHINQDYSSDHVQLPHLFHFSHLFLIHNFARHSGKQNLHYACMDTRHM